MKRIVFIVLSFTVVCFAGLGGYWIGLRRGVDLGGAASAVSEGAVAAAELSLLDRGMPDKARYILEGAVDDGLVGWHKLTSTGEARASLDLLGRNLAPYSAPWLNEDFIRRVAVYRKTHKSPQTLPAALDDVVEKCRGEPGCWDLTPLREREAIIVATTDKYSH
jgi:hypothetical protein